LPAKYHLGRASITGRPRGGLAGAPGEAVQHGKDAMRDVHGAVPDVRFTIEDAAESGDTIWVRARVQGTATGPFPVPEPGTA
jgi:hypothetical protein